MARKHRSKGTGSLFRKTALGPWIASWFDHKGKRREHSTRHGQRALGATGVARACDLDSHSSPPTGAGGGAALSAAGAMAGGNSQASKTLRAIGAAVAAP